MVIFSVWFTISHSWRLRLVFDAIVIFSGSKYSLILSSYSPWVESYLPSRLNKF